MDIPKGFSLRKGDPKEHALKINKNIYGQVQAGKVWYKYLTSKIISIGFTKCMNEECVLIRNKVLYIIYMDDSIIVAPTQDLIDEFLKKHSQCRF